MCSRCCWDARKTAMKLGSMRTPYFRAMHDASLLGEASPISATARRNASTQWIATGVSSTIELTPTGPAPARAVSLRHPDRSMLPPSWPLVHPHGRSSPGRRGATPVRAVGPRSWRVRQSRRRRPRGVGPGCLSVASVSPCTWNIEGRPGPVVARRHSGGGWPTTGQFKQSNGWTGLMAQAKAGLVLAMLWGKRSCGRSSRRCRQGLGSAKTARRDDIDPDKWRNRTKTRHGRPNFVAIAAWPRWESRR